MPTTKQRINLTVSRDIRSSLERLARQDNVRVSTKALSLLETAIEREEDELWVEKAEARMKQKGTPRTHKDMMRRYA